MGLGSSNRLQREGDYLTPILDREAVAQKPKSLQKVKKTRGDESTSEAPSIRKKSEEKN